ncbi:MAG: glycosyltransferase family 2 protein [Candidatus Bathyarchaeota archaeon]|nr:glycosyltransferase family 2 protein [Candidatus Bathyarchaeota archaeon]
MFAYLIRHYIFTLAVLKKANNPPKTVPAAAIPFEPTVSILIPARNEERVLGRLLQRLTEVAYPKNKLQIIVIDDSSTDHTGKIADDYQKHYPYMEVLHRGSHGGIGKAAAMNEGFKGARGEIILCFDADYYPSIEIVRQLTAAFTDLKVGAVQGRVVVLNEPENAITRLVALERVGGYRVDQEARDILGLITQFGGTVGGFRRCVLEQLGGWDEGVLAEDTDLTFRIYLSGYRIKYDVNAECYEEAVNTWASYWRQRKRWAKGHMQCFFKHFWSVLCTTKLDVKQKIDGLLLLNIYFMPILVFASFIMGLILICSNMNPLLNSYYLFALTIILPLSLYSFVGNFAPFFEVSVGLYLDGRRRTQWLVPLSMVTFLYNMPICMLAIFDLAAAKLRRRQHGWVKTVHSGKGERLC